MLFTIAGCDSFIRLGKVKSAKQPNSRRSVSSRLTPQYCGSPLLLSSAPTPDTRAKGGGAVGASEKSVRLEERDAFAEFLPGGFKRVRTVMQMHLDFAEARAI